MYKLLHLIVLGLFYILIPQITWIGCLPLLIKILYLQLFVGGFMSYLRYLCLFTYSGVQHILCCVFVLFVFVLCALCCQLLWIVQLFSNVYLLITNIKAKQ